MSYKNYKNPLELPCWRTCSSCYRCANKGIHAKCASCSGRSDPECRRDPYDIDDYCRCTEGILQFRLKIGKLIRKRFESNPFKHSVITDAESTDEQDWNHFVDEHRERYNDPTWDPIQFPDGTSTTDWTRRQRRGM